MLVLSRRAGERIDIGDEITIEVRKVAGNRVTIALEAPRNLRILRSELKQAAREFEIEVPDPTGSAEPEPEPAETLSATATHTTYAVVHHRLPPSNSVPA